MLRLGLWCGALIAALMVTSLARADESGYSVGAAKIDITPEHPIRLSGYGNRMTESEGVAQPIWAKALAVGDLAHPQSPPAVLITVENCGVPAPVVSQVAKRLQEQAGIPRERLVVAATHTHTGPYLAGGIPFMFAQDPPPDQEERIQRYTRTLTDKLVDVALKAIGNRRPAKLAWAQGKVTFAVNRRVLRDGVWAGFGEQRDGPVDHSLPLLIAQDEQGKLIAVLANYACHCTTLGGDFNQICGDLAGFAQQYIEEDHPGAVGMISIGCGADANPSPRGRLEMCQQQGRALADEVKRLLAQRGNDKPNAEQDSWKSLAGSLECAFDEIELPLEAPPARQHWEAQAKEQNAAGRRARHFLKMLDEGKELPRTVRYPVGVWTFGNDLAMVFLGGEVVVDYAIRMKEEFDANRLWITAYANDAPCYIPSKRLLREGGYEVDGSMIFYGHPTRLAADTEDLIVDTVQRLLPARFYSAQKQQDYPPPLSPDESLKAIVVRPGMQVELVAAEPLVVDPVAFDWGPDGRLWVVEMRDYPNGMDGRGEPGGRVKMLEDTDQDGKYDRATVFLDKLPFPTGVKVWRDGILISAAPDVLFAKDTDQDGKADQVEKLFSGFGEGNQQHRVNGLRWGLDNWLHLGNGDSNGIVRSHKTGQVVNVNGRDLRIRPDEGLIDATSGMTQFGRDRDDWDNWFGGNNSNPMWHYVLDDRYLRRNPHLAPPAVRKQVSVQPGAAPVFPVSRTQARFNDFNMVNRFTSACSPMIYRDVLLGEEYYGNAFVCEPVHNLVHREIVRADGVTFTSRRAEDEQQSEFFASRDNWCRPSMVRLGPDGALWISDMYRFVIEHPTWIPQEWQRRLNLRAGDDRGRIFRVYPEGAKPRPFERLDTLDIPGLVAQLESPNGWRRDMAHQMLIWRNDNAAVEPLRTMALGGRSSQARLHALCVLDGMQSLTPEILQEAFQDKHPAVRRHAVRLAEPHLKNSPQLGEALVRLADDADPQVQMQVAYTLGEWETPQSGRVLAQLALKHQGDAYLLAATLSSVNKTNLATMLETVLAVPSPPMDLVKQLLAPAAALGEKEIIGRVLASLATPADGQYTASQMTALAAMVETLDRRTVRLDARGDETTRQRLSAMVEAAEKLALDGNAPLADRKAAIRLLGSGLGDSQAAAETLGEILVPQNPAELQSAAVAALARLAVPQTLDALVHSWSSFTPALRSEALDALLSRADWTGRLLDLIEQGRVPVAHLDARRREQLLGHKDQKIRSRANQLLGASAQTDRAKVVMEYRHVLSLAGNPARGKAVFVKSCATCHRLEGEGHPVGPDLAALTNRSPEALLIAVLDPNRAVEDKFVNYVAITNDGRQFTGILREETSGSLTLEGPDGKKHVILRKDLEVLAATGKSLMPEGMEKDLSPTDLADVLAYLGGIGPPPKSFPGNRPEVVRAGVNGRLQCLATNGRIYGPTLVFEEQYRNLGFWQSAEDRAVWTIEAPAAGRYRVMLDYACPQESAGDEFVLEVAGQTLTGRVEATGSWDNYRSKPLGEVELPQGQVELHFRSAGPVRNALLDLREIRLTPQ